MTPHSGLGLAFEQLQRMYEALADLRQNVLQRDPRLFELMAEGTLAQIRDLQAQIDAESGLLAAQQAESDLWVRAEGIEIGWPQARSSVLTAILDSLRKGIQNAAEYLLGVGAGGGRPLEVLKQACDLEVLAFQPGSLMVGLRLPVSVESSDRIDLTKVRQALEDYLRAAEWASSEDGIEKLDREFSDEAYRKLLLAEVKRLAPRPKGSLDSIELHGRRVAPTTGARLTRESAQRLRLAMYRDLAHPPEEHEGRIRQIDLDSASFVLRKPDEVSEVRCVYSEEFEETVKEGLDRSVKVSGIVRADQRRTPKVEITNLEILDDGQTG